MEKLYTLWAILLERANTPYERRKVEVRVVHKFNDAQKRSYGECDWSGIGASAEPHHHCDLSVAITSTQLHSQCIIFQYIRKVGT